VTLLRGVQAINRIVIIHLSPKTVTKPVICVNVR